MEMVQFQDMPYKRPDAEALKAALENAIRKLQEAGTYEEARKAYFDLQEEEIRSHTLVSICHVRNTIDTTDTFYEEETRAIREACPCNIAGNRC